MRFICIGSYGDLKLASITPVEFPVVVALYPHKGNPGLAYTHQEFQDLLKEFVKKVSVKIDDRSANYMFYVTGGHPGVIGAILKIVHHHSQDLRRKGCTTLCHFLPMPAYP